MAHVIHTSYILDTFQLPSHHTSINGQDYEIGKCLCHPSLLFREDLQWSLIFSRWFVLNACYAVINNLLNRIMIEDTDELSCGLFDIDVDVHINVDAVFEILWVVQWNFGKVRWPLFHTLLYKCLTYLFSKLII